MRTPRSEMDSIFVWQRRPPAPDFRIAVARLALRSRADRRSLDTRTGRCKRLTAPSRDEQGEQHASASPHRRCRARPAGRCPERGSTGRPQSRTKSRRHVRQLPRDRTAYRSAKSLRSRASRRTSSCARCRTSRRDACRGRSCRSLRRATPTSRSTSSPHGSRRRQRNEEARHERATTRFPEGAWRRFGARRDSRLRDDGTVERQGRRCRRRIWRRHRGAVHPHVERRADRRDDRRAEPRIHLVSAVESRAGRQQDARRASR